MLLKMLCITLFSCSILMARDFPVEGQIFPIAEENLLEVLEKNLKEPSQKQQEKWQKILEEKIKRPTPVQGLQEAKEYNSWYFDPTTTFEEEATDLEGNVIVPAGTKINPLETISLQTGLLFFDGDSDNHVEWAKSQEGEFKWILMKGSPINLEEKEQRNVYFDQGGFLCRTFNVEKIPCRITQKGNKLFVEEIPSE